MTDPGLLRAGNAERSEVVALLEEAAAEGRLTEAELRDRAASAALANTYADLDALVADLPVSPPSRFLTTRHRASTRPGWDPDNPLILGGGTDTDRRKGQWEIPPYIRITAGLATVIMDCLEATCLAPLVEIEVSGGMGTVRIIVPNGWGVNTNQVAKGFGSLTNRVAAEPEPGQPQLVVRGSLGVVSMTVRTASKREQRRLERGRRGEEPPAIGWSVEPGEMPNADDLR